MRHKDPTHIVIKFLQAVTMMIFLSSLRAEAEGEKHCSYMYNIL